MPYGECLSPSSLIHPSFSGFVYYYLERKRFIWLTKEQKLLRLLQKSQREQGWALANTVFERLHTLLNESEHLLYPILNLLMIILALPPGADTAAATAMADIHRALWDYLSSYARIQFGADHAVNHVLGKLSELFSRQKQPENDTIVGGNGDDQYDLLYSIVSDAVDAIGAKKDESGKQTMYYDIVSLWYAETLQ